MDVIEVELYVIMDEFLPHLFLKRFLVIIKRDPDTRVQVATLRAGEETV